MNWEERILRFHWVRVHTFFLRCMFPGRCALKLITLSTQGQKQKVDGKEKREVCHTPIEGIVLSQRQVVMQPGVAVRVLGLDARRGARPSMRKFPDGKGCFMPL